MYWRRNGHSSSRWSLQYSEVNFRPVPNQDSSNPFVQSRLPFPINITFKQIGCSAEHRKRWRRTWAQLRSMLISCCCSSSSSLPLRQFLNPSRIRVIDRHGFHSWYTPVDSFQWWHSWRISDRAGRPKCSSVIWRGSKSSSNGRIFVTLINECWYRTVPLIRIKSGRLLCTSRVRL